MSILIFLIILSALIIVHELGHFLVARYFGIRVDEFGLGYPPKAMKLFHFRGTDFTLNWLPFGGFVKIYGENPDEENQKAEDSFQTKNRGIQASVLVAGVVGNFLFAWLLISLGFVTGLPSPTGVNLPVSDPQTVITTVIPDSPAAKAGLKSGDTIVSLIRDYSSLSFDDKNLSPEAASRFISTSRTPITFKIKRGDNISEKVVTPTTGVIEDRVAVGIAMEVVGTVKLPVHKAIWQGLKTTYELTVATAVALGQLISKAVIGRADLTSVTGPIGIVSMVSDVRELGISYILTFAALLSINLSIINLMPFPALDGGRLLFVIIEAIRRKPVNAKIFNALNTAGFALLIFLMILITVHDVRNFF